ncbi:GDSL-type esterase/lipase family protein [Rhizobium sp. LC145]|uniref:SGNH/GDSL hydrolase family protein n=1 Tax=Rhizobium sp. LC145 TaxID=1120688 RepID=UPI00062A0ACF|nr:GDSL-type esterase/lipase family protein [Rhizobium sp. LC145]KKX28220.1 hypothetical protein YH62_19210 [Rhizobium sp. LC145]
MVMFTKLGQLIAAPVDENGNPRAISPQEFQVWMTEVERTLVALGSVGIDPEDLPPYWLRAVNSGAGTPNAIQATTALPVTEAVLVVLNILDTNTGAPVTVSFNGQAPLTIKTRSGQDIISGGLTPGYLLGAKMGAVFQLFSDEAIASLIFIARDETLAARDRAEVAADLAAGFASDIISQGNVPIFDSRDTAATYVLTGLRAIIINRPAPTDALAPTRYEPVAQPGNVEPLHEAKFQDADGTWWEMAESAPDFRAFGAVDDGATFNDAAWGAAQSYIQAKPGAVLHVRKTLTGVFEYEWRGAFDGPMEVEEGVTFRGAAIQPYVTNKVLNGKLLLKRTDNPVWPNGFEIYPQPQSEMRKSYLTPGDLDFSEPKAVDVTQTLLQMTGWPAVTAWNNAPSTGISRSADLAVFNLETMTAAGFVGVHTKAEAGYSYSASLRHLGTGSLVPACFVRTETRTVAFWFDGSTANTFKIAFLDHLAGTAQEANIGAIAPDQLGYQFRYCQLGIDVISPYHFELTLNGVKASPVSDFSTPGLNGEAILYVGWGFYRGGGLTGSAFVCYPTKTEFFNPSVPKPLRVLTFGDSITDPNIPGWPIYLTELLQGSNGVQIEQLSNVAVSGDSAAQQLEDLQALNLSGYTLAVGMVGTNDIRGQTEIGAFKSTINSIVDLFRNASIPLVLATPPVMYDETEAAAHGGGGFELGNTERGAPYRDLILRVVADSRSIHKQAVGVVDTLRAMPPILARYIDWNAAGSRVDPLVYDNIHLSALGRKYLANALARKALAVLTNSKPTKATSPTVSLSSSWFRNTWTYYGGDSANWWIDEQGVKHLSFSLLTTSGDAGVIADGVVIMQLPIHLRPESRVRVPCSTASNASGTLVFNVDGTVQAFGIVSGAKYVAAQAHYL